MERTNAVAGAGVNARKAVFTYQAFRRFRLRGIAEQQRDGGEPRAGEKAPATPDLPPSSSIPQGLNNMVAASFAGAVLLSRSAT